MQKRKKIQLSKYYDHANILIEVYMLCPFRPFGIYNINMITKK